jgi:hypothetical protein
MFAEKIADYRRKAEECRKQAEISGPEDKAQWFRVAEEWQWLAESVEKIEREQG